MIERGDNRLQSIFFEAIERPPKNRIRFVEDTCGDDPVLRDRVLSLLRSHDSAEEFLEAAPVSLMSLAGSDGRPREEDEDLVGSTFGMYAIERHLGSGGMGTVFLAEQRGDQFTRQVALKVVKRTANTQEIVERFHQERQTLAALDHPGIARLIDGDTLPDGRPFLVMDYIDGRPLFDFCDSCRLGVDARVELFIKICEAVQYCHRHLVIHRDLKPGNVLVTEEGQPKLLDFGIAKVLATSADETSTPTTDAQSRFFTLEYASPEQLRGDRINTVSDVYSLGVILYELLTAQRPRPSTSRTPVKLLEAMERKPPARPSSAAAATDPTQSQLLGPGARRHERRLRGDLDAIALKALRVEPNERYASADELASDLRNYLTNLPVAARRGTWRYKCQRFIRRHRAGAAVTLLTVGVLVAAVATTTWQAREAQRQARAARETRGFLVDLYGATAPAGTETSRAEVERILSQTEVSRLADSLTHEPAEQLEFARAVARIADRHHLRKLSRSWWARAVEAARARADPALLERCLVEAAGGSFDAHRHRRAVVYLEEAVGLRRTEAGPTKLDPSRSSGAEALLTRARWQLGIGDGSEGRELLGLSREERWALESDRAVLLRDLGHGARAIAHLEPLVRDLDASEVRARVTLLSTWASVLWESPRFGEAELVYRRAYDVLWKEGDTNTVQLLELKARIAICVERRHESGAVTESTPRRLLRLRLSWLRRWRDAVLRAYGEGSVEEARTQLTIATNVHPLDGEHNARNAYQSLAEQLGANHREAGEALLSLAACLARPALATEPPEELAARCRRSEATLSRAEEVLADARRRRAHHRAQIAMVRGLLSGHRGDVELARVAFADAHETWAQVLGPGHPTTWAPSRIANLTLLNAGRVDRLELPSPRNRDVENGALWSGGILTPDHDWEAEVYPTLDFDDDYAEKVVVVPEGRWQRAVLWVLGSGYNFGHEVFRRQAPYTMEFNHDATRRLLFQVGSRFMTTDDDLDWTPFEIPVDWLVTGDNTVALFEGPYEEWQHAYPYPWEFNNLRLAVDQDHDADHSWWFGNGQNCCDELQTLAADDLYRKPDGPGLIAHREQGRRESHGELMIFLELVPAP